MIKGVITLYIGIAKDRHERLEELNEDLDFVLIGFRMTLTHIAPHREV